MSLESDDVNASRLVRKNLYRSDQFADSSGVFHRGAAAPRGLRRQPRRSAPARSATGNYDYKNGNVDKIPAYCVIREWHRQERMGRGPMAGLSAIVYVSRPPPPGPDRPQDFDVFAGGASLHVARRVAHGDRRRDAERRRHRGRSLPACGLGSGPDIRRPAVSWDAKTIAFAARATAERPAGDLHDERRRDGLRQAGGHRQPRPRWAAASSSTTSTPRSAPRSTASRASSSRRLAATSTPIAPRSTTPALSARPRTRPSPTRTCTSSKPTPRPRARPAFAS